MDDVLVDYERLIDRFVKRDLSAQEFQLEYLEKFKRETRPIGGELFTVLDALFGDADSFSTDPTLLSHPSRFYLDEHSLRERASKALERLRELKRTDHK